MFNFVVYHRYTMEKHNKNNLLSGLSYMLDNQSQKINSSLNIYPGMCEDFYNYLTNNITYQQLFSLK